MSVECLCDLYGQAGNGDFQAMNDSVSSKKENTHRHIYI